MAIVMDGRGLAQDVELSLIPRVENLASRGRRPKLVVYSFGVNEGNNVYVKQKRKACQRVGITFEHKVAIGCVHQERAEDGLIAGTPYGVTAIVQLPVSGYINPLELVDTMYIDQDVDGFGDINTAHLWRGQTDGLEPCTPKGIMMLLHKYNVPIEGKHAVIVGRSNIVGKPLAAMLLRENATVTICHSKTENLGHMTMQADILISAAGKPGLITADMVKRGAAVIDVGINRVDGKLCGDVDYERVFPKAGWITPVPGGVGVMTVAMLLLNVVEASERMWADR